MKFELNVSPSTVKTDGENEKIVTCLELYIEREEFLSKFENDDINFLETFRQLIYMYHMPYGFVIQLSDICIYQLKDKLIENEKAIGMIFHVHEEDTYYENVYRSNRTVRLDFSLVTLDENGERVLDYSDTCDFINE